MLESHEELKIKCTNTVKHYASGIVFFEKEKVYIASVFGNSLITKDETGCIRTVATNKEKDWMKDKAFKEIFKVQE
jgi:hypothetical protein